MAIDVADLPEIFTHRRAIDLGASDRALGDLRRTGQIVRVARGIYAKPDLDIDLDLAEIALRASRATLCLTSALAHHDLTDDIPSSIDIALPRTHRQPRTTAPVTWHRFDDDTFDIGRSEVPIGADLTLGIYEPARTIVDAYRLRHLYGADQAHEALKRWLRQGHNPSTLLKIAEQFPKAEAALRHALEVLL